jgi:DNA ligase-1
MKTFQKLVKDNRFWEILVNNVSQNNILVKTRYGAIGGKITETNLQSFTKSKGQTFIKKKITDKIRNGYRPVNQVKIKNTQIKDFVKPMGAVLLEKNESKIIFPADAQPKLDGFRGIAIGGNMVHIVSKNGLPYPHLEKIKKELETFPLIKKGYKLDGEIYLHNRTLGELRSVLGRKKLNTEKVIADEKKIKYCVFDIIVENIPSEKRLEMLKDAFKNWKSNLVNLVQIKTVNSIKEVNSLRNKYLDHGFEGIIVRNRDGMYTPGKTSRNVFRSKEFKKDVFKIVGALEGRGNNKGTVIWKLQCLKDKNKSFTAKPIGTKQERTKLYQNRQKYIGMKINIKYFYLNEKTGCVSRHPVTITKEIILNK